MFRGVVAAGTCCLSASGAAVDGAWESSADAGWRGLGRPSAWRLALSGPAFGESKSLSVGAHTPAGRSRSGQDFRV